jgi:hypothetical protein
MGTQRQDTNVTFKMTQGFKLFMNLDVPSGLTHVIPTHCDLSRGVLSKNLSGTTFFPTTAPHTYMCTLMHHANTYHTKRNGITDSRT